MGPSRLHGAPEAAHSVAQLALIPSTLATQVALWGVPWADLWETSQVSKHRDYQGVPLGDP
eukprot:13606100-Alexandrium_andersonii.AAC.1